MTINHWQNIQGTNATQMQTLGVETFYC